MFSIDGELVTTIGDRGTGPGKFYLPVGIYIDKDGHIVVDRKETSRFSSSN